MSTLLDSYEARLARLWKHKDQVVGVEIRECTAEEREELERHFGLPWSMARPWVAQFQLGEEVVEIITPRSPFRSHASLLRRLACQQEWE